MPGAREDYLLRMLTQVAAVLRRVRERLAGGESAAELLPALRDAEGELLGGRASLLKALDARTAAQLLSDPETVLTWVALLRLEAAVHRRAGDEAAAARAESRAAALEATRGTSS
jgi:hypothetical protein